MALTDDGGMIMPVAPTGAFGGNGFGGNMGEWLVFFIIAMMFGNGGFGGWGGYGNNGAMGYDFPWILNGQNNTDNLVSNGFQNAQLANQLTGIQSGITSGFGDVQTALCGGFAGVNATVNGAQSAISQQLYSNQLADLERSFAAQTANTQGMNTLQSQMAQCCCDQRLATAQTQALVQSENCADRYEAAQNTANIINAITSGIQSIKDDLCADRLEAERRENANLRSELMFARGQASQDVQTAAIQAGQRALANEIEQTVVPTPRPAYIVQNPYTAQTYYGCGCGCGA